MHHDSRGVAATANCGCPGDVPCCALRRSCDGGTTIRTLPSANGDYTGAIAATESRERDDASGFTSSACTLGSSAGQRFSGCAAVTAEYSSARRHRGCTGGNNGGRRSFAASRGSDRSGQAEASAHPADQSGHCGGRSGRRRHGCGALQRQSQQAALNRAGKPRKAS